MEVFEIFKTFITADGNPLLFVILFSIAYIGWEVKKNNKFLTKSLEDTNKRIDNLEQKLCFVHQDSIPRTDFYNDVSGWRGDLKSLSDKVDLLMKENSYIKGKLDHVRHNEQ